MDVARTLDYPNGLIGTVIEDRYRIDSVIAQGGMGTVFRATHLSLQRNVALKILRPDLESDQTQRFLREANIVAQLEHRNCVTVFDHGRSKQGFHFIAMQLLKGSVLTEEIKKGPLEPTRAAALMLDVLHGLEHAHARHVVHRDLKPDNLFLTTDEDGNEVIKLLDFGVARFKQTSESSGAAVTLSGLMSGTPAYMSPEQVIGADTDESTDIYAAGVIFYEMLAGGLPFSADDPVVLFQNQLNDAFPPLPDDVPEGLQEVIERMCDKERAKRYPSASAVIEDVEAFLVESTDGNYAASSSSTRRWASSTGASSIPSVRGPITSAGPEPTTGVHGAEPSGKRPWWHFGAAAGLALLVGAVAFPMLSSDGETAQSDPAPAAAAPVQGQSAAAADSSAPTNDRSGFLSLLAKVNDPDHPLPYEARKQALQTLAQTEYEPKIDTRLQTGLDLVQASDSPTPCETFHGALTEIQSSDDAFYVDYLSEAEVPQKGEGESAEACQGLEGMLSTAQTAAIGSEESADPQSDDRAADGRSSRRRAPRRRARQEQDEPRAAPSAAPPSQPASKPEPAAPKVDKVGPGPKTPPKLPSGSEAKGVTKLDPHDIRGL